MVSLIEPGSYSRAWCLEFIGVTSLCITVMFIHVARAKVLPRHKSNAALNPHILPLALFLLPLQHRAKGSEDPYKEIDGIATTRYSVGGLSPYSHYDFRVAAVNTIGQGPSSEAVEARTAEQAPSSPPRQVGMKA